MCFLQNVFNEEKGGYDPNFESKFDLNEEWNARIFYFTVNEATHRLACFAPLSRRVGPFTVLTQTRIYLDGECIYLHESVLSFCFIGWLSDHSLHIDRRCIYIPSNPNRSHITKFVLRVPIDGRQYEIRSEAPHKPGVSHCSSLLWPCHWNSFFCEPQYRLVELSTGIDCETNEPVEPIKQCICTDFLFLPIYLVIVILMWACASVGVLLYWIGAIFGGCFCSKFVTDSCFCRRTVLVHYSPTYQSLT